MGVRRFVREGIRIDHQAKSDAGGDIDLGNRHTQSHVVNGPAVGFENRANDY